MKENLNKLKAFVKKEPFTSAAIASIAIGTVLKSADQIIGIRSKNAYAKQVNRSLKRNPK